MPYCPRCRSEYREGRTRCPDCEEALRPGAPPPEEGLRLLDDPEHEPVVLCRVADISEAQLICGALREQNITYLSQASGPLRANLALVTDGQAPEDCTIIHVARAQLEEAQQLLTALRAAPFAWPAGLEPEDPAP